MRLNLALATLLGFFCLPAAAQTVATNATPALKIAFAGHFPVGAAVGWNRLRVDERTLLFSQFNAVTSENGMKMGALHPAEDVYRFREADALVEAAAAHGLEVNGHTLVWHSQCPDWFFAGEGGPAGRDLVLKRLRDHVTTIAGHYAGKVRSWDVVNEAIDDGPEFLRRSPWLTAIGEDFIAEAFRSARAADPKALLLYNDYGIEMPGKRDKALRLLRGLKEAGVPVDGVGIQGHWQLDHVPYREMEDAILAFHALGLKVMITELDLDVITRAHEGADVANRQAAGRDPYAAGAPDDVLRRQAEQYGRLFALFAKHRDKIGRVTFWGLHDGHSWLNFYPYRRTNHALLWDRALRPKPALEAVLSAARP